MLHKEERKENRTAGALFLLVMVQLEGQAIKLLYLYLLLPSRVSRISDDMLLGAIAAVLGIWVIGVTITSYYLVIRK
jgi:hypothetical protein